MFGDEIDSVPDRRYKAVSRGILFELIQDT
jgi:hypothetical protein